MNEKTQKKLWLATAIATVVTAVAAIVLIFVFSEKVMIFPVVLCVIVALHGFIGAPIYFYEFAKLRLICRVKEMSADADVQTICSTLGIKKSVCEKILK